MRLKAFQILIRKILWRFHLKQALNLVFARTNPQSIVVVTGPEISASVGLDQFGASGLIKKIEGGLICNETAFNQNPRPAIEFYNLVKRHHRDVKPTLAHWALADLERRFEGRMTILTQNIDELHDLARSKRVIYLNGTIWRTRCRSCRRIWSDTKSIAFPSTCVICKAKNSLRPDILLPKEEPRSVDLRNLIQTDTLVILLGCRELDYPFAEVLERSHACGAEVICLKSELGPRHEGSAQVVLGPLSRMVPELRTLILGRSKPS